MFKKFNSIENISRQKFVDKALNLCLPCEWVATEKIHGTNFAFVYDGNTMECGRKEALLVEGEKFYGYPAVKERWSPNVIGLYDYLGCSSLNVYGELFGPGVQSGIHYSKEKNFYAFDIMIDGLYIDVDRCEELFEQFDFFYALPLVKGTITECFDYPNEFDSTIPALLGEEHVVDNICEGTVIRPNTITFFPSGSRCIFKNKNPKWSESTKTRKPKTVFVLSDEVMVALEASTAHITLNRLRNVISKVGCGEQNAFPKVCGLMTKDVIEEFIKDFDINSLEKNDRKVLTKQINKLCGNLLREHFLNIIDGNF